MKATFKLVNQCKLINVIQISSDFPTGFHWVSKCMHVMWHACDVACVDGLATITHELMMSARHYVSDLSFDQI